MNKLTTKMKVLILGVITASLAYLGINVVNVQDYTIVKKTTPTSMPTQAITPTTEPTIVPTASPSATFTPLRRVVTPVAKPTL